MTDVRLQCTFYSSKQIIFNDILYQNCLVYPPCKALLKALLHDGVDKVEG